VDEKELTREAYNYIVHRRKPLKFVQLIEGRVIADIGCGSGQNCMILKAKVRLCIDFSRKQLYEARKKGCEHLLEADMEYLPLRDSCLDGAVFIASIHHLETPDNSLKEAYRVLKKHGNILLTVWLVQPRFLFRRRVTIRSVINGKEVYRFYRLYLPGEIKKVVEKEGFRTLKYINFRQNSIIPNNGLYIGVKD